MSLHIYGLYVIQKCGTNRLSQKLGNQQNILLPHSI